MMKQLYLVLLMMFSFHTLYAKQDICHGKLKVLSIENITPTRSGRVHITSDINFYHKNFGSCPKKYLRFFKEGKNKKVHMMLEIEPYTFKAKQWYEVLLYYDTLEGGVSNITVTKQLQQKTKNMNIKGFTHYDGNRIEIQYPRSFNAIAKEPTDLTTLLFYDEVSFVAPDKSVSFYLFHVPPPNYEKPTYFEPAPNEVLVSEKAQKSDDPNAYYDYLFTLWRTFKAKDGSYYRSYVAQRACHEGKFDECGMKIFGITYKEKKSYNRYKADYLRFKKSLIEWHVK